MGGKMIGISEQFGYRPIMVVQSFNFMPQYNERPPATWFYGLQLMTQFDNPTLFVTFLNNFKGTPFTWAQLAVATHETIQQVEQKWPQQPIHSVATEVLTLLAAGKDPIRGYFLQFAGSVNRLFSQPDWWKESSVQF